MIRHSAPYVQGNSLDLGRVEVCQARPVPARLLRRQRPRVKLNREAVGRPLFAYPYPFIEVDTRLKLDPMASGPDDDPRPLGVVLGHAKSVGAHERMFHIRRKPAARPAHAEI
jgi:hypothetical protein